MGIRDYVMNPGVIHDLNRAIRRAFRHQRNGGKDVVRILVADDEVEIRESLRHELERVGYEVSTAANGAEALEIQRGQPVDLLITDIFMPELDGLETITALHRSAPELKIIAIASETGPEGRHYLRAARSFGAARTLTKPIRPFELLAAVKELLES
jgi:CheY-like chemotaxis protein